MQKIGETKLLNDEIVGLNQFRIDNARLQDKIFALNNNLALYTELYNTNQATITKQNELLENQNKQLSEKSNTMNKMSKKFFVK